MSFYLDQVPKEGVLKKEHDARVERTHRPFTDPFVSPSNTSYFNSPDEDRIDPGSFHKREFIK